MLSFHQSTSINDCINALTLYSQSSSLSSFEASFFFSSFGLPGARLVAPDTIS
jgi:hypothetical protein